ncbi:hypothetical protein V5O48_014776 [Marasmius crinis-equi]|uniref:Uncharacterized protein n=1 Tax=Marasmius crinis-equi TaxID=585013 RepID=A0ABR3EWE9_9AGAR
MLSHFSPWHIPPLFIATTTTFGGLWPFFNARAATLEFGLPPRVANSPEAQSVMICCSGRTTVIGALIFAFYSQRKLEAVDTVLAVMGVWIGITDGYVCWKEGVPGRGLFRATCGFLIGAYGLVGWTARSAAGI